ncbi:MAG: GNAT family N-acetyltransferase [Rhodomicrobiaceae bacterium]
MDANTEIRSFEAADLKALQQIRHAAFEPIFRSFRAIVGAEIYRHAFANADAEQARLLEDICADGSGHELFVASVRGGIVGFVSFSLNEATRTGEIGLNAVHPDHAGQGIGAAMYEFVMERMKRRGMAVATVGTGGDPGHLPARRAYEKAGFGPAVPSLYLYKLL